MTIKHMRIYLEVYRMEHITKAAERLHMTQPAVTRAIREIEDYYGIRLFERISRRLYVTEAGREFYAYALHITDSFDQMETELRNWDKFGVLRVGTSVTIGNFLLPEVLKQFKEKHPKFRIRATVSNGRKVEELLMDNRLDLGVVEGRITGEFLHAEVIGSDRLVPVLPPDSVFAAREDIRLEELAGEAMILREEGSAGRSFINDVFSTHGLHADPVMESISTRAILQAVSAGLGISFLPEKLAREWILSGKLATCRVMDETFTRENYVVWHKHKFLTESAKEAIGLFRKVSGEIT